MQSVGHAGYLELVPPFATRTFPADQRTRFVARGDSGGNGDARVCVQFPFASRTAKDGCAGRPSGNDGGWNVRGTSQRVAGRGCSGVCGPAGWIAVEQSRQWEFAAAVDEPAAAGSGSALVAEGRATAIYRISAWANRPNLFVVFGWRGAAPGGAEGLGSSERGLAAGRLSLDREHAQSTHASRVWAVFSGADDGDFQGIARHERDEPAAGFSRRQLYRGAGRIASAADDLRRA